jgi:hypothetical protein
MNKILKCNNRVCIFSHLDNVSEWGYLICHMNQEEDRIRVEIDLKLDGRYIRFLKY